MTHPSHMTIDDLKSEIERSRSAIGECEEILASLRSRLGECRRELDVRTRPEPEPKVSSHAVLRYLERVKGIDVAAVEKEILDESLVRAMRLGATGMKKDGVRFVLEGYVVKTVVPA